VIAASALGEGTFVSSISGWYTGKDSRVWNDGNRDATSTYVRFRGCTRTNGGATGAGVQVKRQRGFAPDEGKGTKTLYCGNVDTAYWGDLQASNYYFRLEKIAGRTSGEQLWVDSLRVAY